MTTLHFAQISDVHISELGDRYDMLSGRSANFLANTITWLNQLSNLDFVLFSGDLLDIGSHRELEQFQAEVRHLQKPWFVIPGNHDRREPGRDDGLSRHDFARLFNPQYAERPQAPAAQAGYWSVGLAPDVQLIGLDSIKDDDWGGVIDAAQLEWLSVELAAHTHKLVLLAVHHPLHQLAPIDTDAYWHRFVCDNGAEVLALLDRHPQVKLVLTGHHHLTKADRLKNRWHLACPAMAIYPCAYRTLQLTAQPGGAWQLEWGTHSAADLPTIAEAEKLMVTMWQEVGFDPAFVEEHVMLARGSRYDRYGSVML